MPKTDDGAIYGVKSLKFNGVELGLISEDGLQPGGDSPSKVRVWSAQKRNAPFAVIKSNPGTKVWTFTLIEMIPENIVQVAGGEVESDGSYSPPAEDVELEGVFDIETVTGHTMRINKGLLTTSFANGFNFQTTFGLACELEMQEAGKDQKPYRLFPPDVEPPAIE